MSKKLFIGLLMVMAFCLVQIAPAMAADQAAAPKAEKKEAAAKTKHTGGMAANVVAVCACGKVFTPTAETKYLTVDGKKYACCSDGCHEMGMKDPAKAAKMAEENMAKVMAGGGGAAAPTQK